MKTQRITVQLQDVKKYLSKGKGMPLMTCHKYQKTLILSPLKDLYQFLLRNGITPANNLTQSHTADTTAGDTQHHP